MPDNVWIFVEILLTIVSLYVIQAMIIKARFDAREEKSWRLRYIEHGSDIIRIIKKDIQEMENSEEDPDDSDSPDLSDFL